VCTVPFERYGAGMAVFEDRTLYVYGGYSHRSIQDHKIIRFLSYHLSLPSFFLAYFLDVKIIVMMFGCIRWIEIVGVR